MAVGKEAPVPSAIAVAAAACDSLNAAVAEFSEIMAATPVTTIKRRLRDSDIALPFPLVELSNGFFPSKPIEPGFAPSAVEGLEKK